MTTNRVALALVDAEHADTRGPLIAHVVGVERGAQIIDDSRYVPSGGGDAGLIWRHR